jgi:hypothetical protein
MVENYKEMKFFLRRALSTQLKRLADQRETSTESLLNECVRYYLEHATQETRPHIIHKGGEITAPHVAVSQALPKLYLRFNQREYLIHQTPFTIGRAQSCDLVIDNKNISQHHCQIELEGGELLIQDNNSTNGVYVNSERVKISRRHILEGDQFYLCDLCLEFSYKGFAR